MQQASYSTTNIVSKLTFFDGDSVAMIGPAVGLDDGDTDGLLLGLDDGDRLGLDVGY